MTQKIRDKILQNRTNRLDKIALQTRVYKTLGTGIALSYRRTSGQFGNWGLRMLLADGRYRQEVIGAADDYDAANGETIFTFEQAQGIALTRFNAVQKDGGTITTPYTFNEAIAAYMAWFRIHRKSIAETEAMINAHIAPAFGDVVIDKLKPTSIKTWLTAVAAAPARKRTKMGVSVTHRDAPTTDTAKRSRKATANRILTVLKAILNKAYDDDKVSTNHAWKKVKPFNSVDEPIVRFLQPSEATRLINACPPDFKALINAALMTGARYSELTAMTVADFSQQGESVFIRPSKSGKGRHIPLTAEGAQLFVNASLGKTGTALIFARADGSAWGKNYQVRPLLAANKNANIEPAIGFHELRHTYASFLANAGADLLTISKLLGHADTRITSRHYAHLCDKTLKNAVHRYLPTLTEQVKGNVTPFAKKAL